MDELKISSSIMRRMISKVIESIICKKIGYNVKISLNDLYVSVNESSAHVNVKIEADMPIDELKKITKLIGTE